MTQELTTTNGRREIVTSRPNTNGAITPSEWQMMKEIASVVFKSTFAKGCTSEQAALTIMLQGRELGLQPMAAIRNIYVIEGKPSLSADLMSALVIQQGHPPIKVVESTPEKCTVIAQRRGGEPYTHTFTIKEADKAGLLNKSNWKSYPASMLRARAIGGAARIVFPDVLAGVYTPDELGATVSYSADGQEVVIEGSTVEQRQDIPPAADYGDREPDEDAVLFFGEALDAYSEVAAMAQLDNLAEQIKQNKNRLSKVQIDQLLAAHASAKRRIKAASVLEAEMEVPA